MGLFKKYYKTNYDAIDGISNMHRPDEKCCFTVCQEENVSETKVLMGELY
jgi:hypothetical protein